MIKKLFVPALALVLTMTACSNKKATADQSSPKGTAEMIFSAAKTGDFSHLKDIVAETADNDAKRFGTVATDPKKDQDEFKEAFAKSTTVGDAVIDGDKAAQKITIGKNADKEETLNMVKKDGKWYVESF